MGAVALIGRFVLMALNTVFAIAGIVLVLIGVFVRYAGDTVISMLYTIIRQLNSFSDHTGIEPIGVTYKNFNFVEILQQNSIPFIVVGGILGCVAIFGCIGSCNSIGIVLLVYAVLMCVVLGAQVLAAAVIGGNSAKYEQDAVDFVKGYIKSDYAGMGGSDVFSLMMNAAMMNLNCCGVENYTDFQGATRWNHTNTYFYAGELRKNLTGNFTIPISCCVMNEPYPSITPIDLNCPSTPAANNSWIDMPCLTKIKSYISQYELYVILSVVGLFVVQLLIIIIAFIVWKDISGDSKTSPV